MLQLYTAIDKTDWLKHIKAIIDTSIFIVDAVANQNISVLVHCSG
jgi:myotubularin-related protein 6/7/8